MSEQAHEEQRTEEAREKVEAGMEQRFRRLRLQLFFTLLGVVLSVAAMSVTSVILSARASNRSNTALCPLFESIDEGYKQVPPKTAAGAAFATKIHIFVQNQC